MILKPIHCPTCETKDVVKHGKTETGKQRYLCKPQRTPSAYRKNTKCSRQTFVLENAHKGRLPYVKEQIIEMSLNGSGIRDIARVLEISPVTVISEIKKNESLLNG